MRWLAALLISPIIAIAMILVSAYLWLAWHACITETRQTISGLVGFDFEIIDNNCDTLAKEDWISVYAVRPGRPKKVLLFQYAPGADTLPVITSIDQHTIQISLPRISSVQFRRNKLQDLTVRYNIDSIDYPDITPAK